MKHAISVVVPAYNEEKYIADCLRSLEAQDFELPYEILVVNNNSTDQTAKIASSFGHTRVINESHQGVIFARQKGVLAAEAPIIAMADADTKPPSDWLRRIYASFHTDDIVAVAGPTHFFDGPWWYKILLDASFWLVSSIYDLTGVVVQISANNIAFRRDVFVSFGGYDTNLSIGEDELGLLLKLKKCGRVFFDKNIVNYASGRRANQGLCYTFLHDIIYTYVIGSVLNTLLGRQIVKYYSAKR